jgi:hypothetical protein
MFGAKTAEVPTAAAPYKVPEPTATEIVPVTDASVIVAVEPVTTAVLEVKAKFKKADLDKMTKAQLVALAEQQGLEIKARAVKADLIKALLKS